MTGVQTCALPILISYLQIFKWYDIVPNKILLLFNSYDDKGEFLISKVRGAMPMNHEFPSARKLDSYMI